MTGAALREDIVVGDAEGVVVIPASMANEIAREAAEMTRYDEFAAEKIRDGGAVPGLYPAGDAARAEFAAWLAARENRETRNGQT